MAALSFAKPRLITFNGTAITDHNRSDLSVDVERIETTKRMANGTLRKYVVADKRTFSTSWSMLPNSKLYTVDGYEGVDGIESFYNNTEGSFTLGITLGDSITRNFTVMFTDFSKSLSKRGKFDFYDVDITLEEV